MTAIMISTISVTDPKGFQDYMARTQAVARPYGAQMMFRGQRSETLSGNASNGDMVVVVSFPDLEALQRWHASPEYREIIALRDASSDQVMTAYGPMS
ncbi:DUF1330 domain-containing protein [Roseobacter sp. YSTF-M11]|uniref:DUF1330 domain-containing protein n=1 Tax=Roseobacter insulae TaxID=2859783 RepID=A0A9X1FTG0_9RHOB|nr:DUF1330 domain-containing protein [Roseobacter insulae]MBW4706598.1 DUF1330 domain-containing protein [Roseobacter insulae]